MTSSDAQLLLDARNAPAAFEQLVARHLDTVYRYVARRLGPTNAEDVVSEVFATAYAIRGRYDASRPSALPWLTRTTAGCARCRSGRTQRHRTKHGSQKPFGSKAEGVQSFHGPVLVAARRAGRGMLAAQVG